MEAIKSVIAKQLTLSRWREIAWCSTLYPRCHRWRHARRSTGTKEHCRTTNHARAQCARYFNAVATLLSIEQQIETTCKYLGIFCFKIR